MLPLSRRKKRRIRSLKDCQSELQPLLWVVLGVTDPENLKDRLPKVSLVIGKPKRIFTSSVTSVNTRISCQTMA